MAVQSRRKLFAKIPTNKYRCWQWRVRISIALVAIAIADGITSPGSSNVLHAAEPASETRARYKVAPVPEKTVVLRLKGPPVQLLARDIVRQAFLMTAQEQFHLATPDAFSPASFPDPAMSENWPFELMVNNLPNGRVEYRIHRTTPEKIEELFKFQLDPPTAETFEILPQRAVQLMREEFREILSRANYPSSASEVQNVTPVSEMVIDWQMQLDPISQFAALRQLHHQADSEERSAGVYSRLARGYAMLGSQSEWNWNATHKTFKARALIWSERAVSEWPDQPEVWYARAYVRALCGLPSLAIKDLQQVEKLVAGPLSIEGETLKAYCSWDLDELESLADDGHPLADYLRVLALEQVGSERQQLIISQQLSQRYPECWRVSASLAVSDTLGTDMSVQEPVWPKLNRLCQT
ncbi:hypothetical protein GC163_16050 [bacterium]|nr:hypothetical protein [bacterium]